MLVPQAHVLIMLVLTQKTLVFLVLTISEHFLVRDPNDTNESDKLPPFVHESYILIRKRISYAVLKSLKPIWHILIITPL